ncbi:MAG TPA: RdgB/HAM1 family non-canonical purine NTP pyrophosphatase [Minicystis sp.]|nr:RdgB/HAM1 family non-canonical purine NTP pyrophosphatase [Minicystis sp.]
MIARPVTLLVATTNRAKLVELAQLLGDLPIELLPLSASLPNRPPPVEDGATFEENARIKVRAAAAAAMMPTLAEDSGLEVDALGGRPGVRSARFSKEGATDAENNAAVLKLLEDIEDDQRHARFRCAMVLLDPWKEGEPREVLTEGRCEGQIARQLRGSGGFGYDPLFVVNGFERTMAELSDAEKNVVSHRARAVEAMRPHLVELVERRVSAARRVLG